MLMLNLNILERSKDEKVEIHIAQYAPFVDQYLCRIGSYFSGGQ